MFRNAFAYYTHEGIQGEIFRDGSGELSREKELFSVPALINVVLATASLPLATTAPKAETGWFVHVVGVPCAA